MAESVLRGAGSCREALLLIRPLGLREQCAIDPDGLSADERRSLAGEKNHGWRDAVYPDSVAAQLHGSLFGEHLNSPLARRVGHQRRECEFVATRAEVHDRASAMILHVPGRLLRAQKATF